MYYYLLCILCCMKMIYEILFSSHHFSMMNLNDFILIKKYIDRTILFLMEADFAMCQINFSLCYQRSFRRKNSCEMWDFPIKSSILNIVVFPTFHVN